MHSIPSKGLEEYTGSRVKGLKYKGMYLGSPKGLKGICRLRVE